MKYSRIYNDLLGCKDSDEVFEYLVGSLTNSISGWDYFVDWSKVLKNYRNIELELHLLDYLIGKDDVRGALAELLERHPTILRLLPVLLAIRETQVTVLTKSISEANPHRRFNFKERPSLSQVEIEEACEFAAQSGLLDLFRNKTIRSVADYVLGIEVGLDSNGRKNRSGTGMERLVEELISGICDVMNLSYLRQATAATIQATWGITVKVDKSSRDFDFAIRSADILYVIETNYYGGGGSKLKATAGEYQTLHNFLSADGHKFIWITDGLGWKRAARPLEEAFNKMAYILNLKMSMSGILGEILAGKF